MNGSGGVGFVLDTATLFLIIVGFAVLAGVWVWLSEEAVKSAVCKLTHYAQWPAETSPVQCVPAQH